MRRRRRPLPVRASVNPPAQEQPALPYIRDAPIIPVQPVWWKCLARAVVRPFTQDWSKDCSFCGVLLLSTEADGWCCQRGHRRLSHLPPFAPAVQSLLDRYQGRLSSMSRRLNNLFAFSAIGTTGQFVRFQGQANVVLEGRVYHRLLDVADTGHSMHWFLFDESERDLRASDHNVPHDILYGIRDFLSLVNPYVRTLQHAVSQVRDQSVALAVELSIPPAGGELAAVITTENLRHVAPRQVVFYRRGGQQPQFVPALSCHYEPLQYPLLFPHGTRGWGFLDESRKNIPCTQIQWYRHLFLGEPRMRIFGRLACEYAVDMFSRTEEERLHYLKRGRRVQAAAMDEAPNPDIPDLFENKIPAGFMGSRAWASDQVADSLAIARQLGKPSLFLTMTTNPNWPEIQSQLLPGQHYTEIPAVVCRAFHGRLWGLKAFLRRRFGGLLYEICVTEFQKRGLPHAHLVIKLQHELPLSQLDGFICAELPDPDEDPALHAAIGRFHMHSQNHLDRPTSRCNRDGRCIYGYPQPINNQTYMDDLGRVHYRRRKQEDRWVTPHVPVLVHLLDCHIYADVCSTATIFLYLFKYLFKGPDRARFGIRALHDTRADGEEEQVDEFRDYMNARYLSSSEAAYRILNFHTVSKRPGVRCLSVHLEGKNLGRMYDRSHPGYSEMSDLLWYFKRPSTETFSRLKYTEFFSLYYLETVPLDVPLDSGQTLITTVTTEKGLRQKVLRRRVRQPIVTRLQTVPLRLKETFYLRALLQVRPTSSFEDARTIRGHCYPTYQEAATALGLFQDDHEAVYAMNEAITAYSRPSQLRFLFAQLLSDLPFPAVELWSRFHDDLCADYRLRHPTARATDLALQDLARYLSAQGSSLAQCGLPESVERCAEVDLELAFFQPQLSSIRGRSEEAYGRMNSDQKGIFDHLLGQLDVGGCYFIDGRAGRGKTFLMSAICDRIRALGDFRQVAPVVRGSSGPTATLNSSIRTSTLWHHFKVLRLSIPVRQAGDPVYARWVDQVGDGEYPYETSVPLHHLQHLGDLDAAADFLFPQDSVSTSAAAVQRAFLSPFNARVDLFNRLILERLPGRAETYYSHDTIKELDDSTINLPTGAEADLLSVLNEPGVPSHELSLKIGAVASVMRNFSVEKNLVKNMRVQVVNLLPNVVQVRLLQRTCLPNTQPPTFYLPRITFEFRPHRANWTVQRRQFPLRLAYATTFNSCQGLTLDRVVLDLTLPVFAHGQLYTSLSRVRSAVDMRILRDPNEIDQDTPNVVYHELLLPL
ncbi:ATP-dependent DNA helicase PIF1 [Penicillium rolfsii]|nr:ATP-dependent DNA helicase PIF1 [Penicillium rolfsii]